MAAVIACGGGMSGAGGGGSSDATNQAAVDVALQAMLAAHVRDVCQSRSTCGAAETRLPLSETSPDPETVDVLIARLGADDAMARDAAAWSLGRLGPLAAAALPRLRAVASEDAAFSVRCRAADAISAIGGERTEPAWVLEPDDLYAIGTPPPSGACADVARTLCTPMAVELDGACLVGLSAGDAGGTVATFAREALETAPHGAAVDGAPADPLQLVTVAGEPWVVSGHAVHRISRDSAGRLRADKLADLKDVPTWYRVDGATLVVQTTDRVIYRVTKRGAR